MKIIQKGRSRYPEIQLEEIAQMAIKEFITHTDGDKTKIRKGSRRELNKLIEIIRQEPFSQGALLSLTKVDNDSKIFAVGVIADKTDRIHVCVCNYSNQAANVLTITPREKELDLYNDELKAAIVRLSVLSALYPEAAYILVNKGLRQGLPGPLLRDYERIKDCVHIVFDKEKKDL